MLQRLRQRLKRILLRQLGLHNHYMYGYRAYSQEGEDLLLSRLMDGQKAPGTYVDVGCNHPFRMSNTAMFYERGWSGITIDANPNFAASFRELRPRDTFVNSGVGLIERETVLYRFEQPLLSTFDAALADKYEKSGHRILDQIAVPVRPLASILAEHWPNGNPIGLLSVDCEGLDEEVIKSHDFERYPVDFVCVEQANTNILDICKLEGWRYLDSAGFTLIARLHQSSVYARVPVG